MKHRNQLMAVLAAAALFVAVALSGCGGASNHIGSHHRVLKSIGGAVVIHHVLKQRGSRHALLKSAAGGVVIHHVLKRYGK